jgi:outer membrane receptor protein involved in Fe transport
MNYSQGGLHLYANASYETTMVEDVVSAEYIIGDPDELAYLSNHFVSSSDAQTISASFGASYAWHGLLVSMDGIYGSGLPEGFANEQNAAAYTQWNAALAQSFYPWDPKKALTLRLSALNLFDEIYVLRSGSGVGELAPQYGPRRGVFAELSQQF